MGHVLQFWLRDGQLGPLHASSCCVYDSRPGSRRRSVVPRREATLVPSFFEANRSLLRVLDDEPVLVAVGNRRLRRLVDLGKVPDLLQIDGPGTALRLLEDVGVPSDFRDVHVLQHGLRR